MGFSANWFLYFCLVTRVLVIQPATIRVALYNSIPDLNEDGLQSYKKMVESQFQMSCNDKHRVEVTVSSAYDPYAEDLAKYTSKYNLMEIDAVTLGKLVGIGGQQSFIVPLEETGVHIEDNRIFQPAINAMTANGKVYGYPTLLCGNLVTSIRPLVKCPIDEGTALIPTYKKALGICAESYDVPIGQEANLKSSFTTLLRGKMMDEWGWYLPYIYLDGYIDMYGRSTLDEAVSNLNKGIVDESVCKELRWFTSLCKDDETGANVCLKDLSTSDILNSVASEESVLMFSFSEILSELMKITADGPNPANPVTLASVPLGNKVNSMLQFTDGLVVSKQLWNAAANDERDAIKHFIEFFTSEDFRYKIAYGFDLKKPQVRYLLMPNKKFYKEPSAAAYDPIYKEARLFLENAVPAPPLGSTQSDIQALLEKDCLGLGKSTPKTEL